MFKINFNFPNLAIKKTLIKITLKGFVWEVIKVKKYKLMMRA